MYPQHFFVIMSGCRASSRTTSRRPASRQQIEVVECGHAESALGVRLRAGNLRDSSKREIKLQTALRGRLDEYIDHIDCTLLLMLLDTVWSSNADILY